MRNLTQKFATHQLRCELLEDRLAPNNLLGLTDGLPADPAPDAWLDPVGGIFADRHTPTAFRCLADGLAQPGLQAVALSAEAMSPAIGALTPAKAEAASLLGQLPARADTLEALLNLDDLGRQGGGADPGRGANPGVFPPDSRPYGATYGQWAARWWQAAFSIPIVNGHHPIIDGGAFGGQPVLFLTGVGGGSTINLTVQAGTPLFFPVINAECSVIEPDPFHGDNATELRACANHHMDHTSGRSAAIDGRPVNHLDAYRFESPLFEFGPLPANNLLAFFGVDAPEGAMSKSVDAGYYLFMAPLSVGAHTLHFSGTFDELGFSIDTTYSITVRP